MVGRRVRAPPLGLDGAAKPNIEAPERMIEAAGASGVRKKSSERGNTGTLKPSPLAMSGCDIEFK